MAPPSQPTHDSAPVQSTPNSLQIPAPQSQAGITGSIPAASDLNNIQLQGLDHNQILSILRHLPLLGRLNEGNTKEDAAQVLSNLAAFSPGAAQYPPQGTSTGLPGINDPGPSSHPRGPPNLGQLSAVALQATSAASQPPRPEGSVSDERTVQQLQQAAQLVQAVTGNSDTADKTIGSPAVSVTTSGGRRRNPAMGSDEWTRQRKDNHKEVERRRRGNINEGINELGRIVPSGNGEKAKGAILARSVQYIHHLKENEARNIEKWTLEKLLMDQAMGDLQNQLEEVKRMWEEERSVRQRLELELETLRNTTRKSAAPVTTSAASQSFSQSQVIRSPNVPNKNADIVPGAKRKSEEVPDRSTRAGESEGDRDGKRLRTD